MFFGITIPFTKKAIDVAVLQLFGNWNYWTIATLDFSLRLKGDHAPSFTFNIVILNVSLIEISFYDTRHEEHRT